MPQLSCGTQVKDQTGPWRLTPNGPWVPTHQFAERVDDVYPVILWRVVAEKGPGETAAHVDQIVEGHGGDAALGDGDAGP